MQVLVKVAFGGHVVGTICRMGDGTRPGGRGLRLGVDLNIIDPIGEISAAMDGGVIVGEVHGSFVEMHLESVVTKLAD